MQTISVSAHITRLLAAVFVPLALFATGVLVWSGEQERARTETRLMDTTAALALAVDQFLGVRMVALSTLAESAALAQGDDKGFHAFAQRVADRNGTWIVLFDPSGVQRMNTRFAWNEPIPQVPASRALHEAVVSGKPGVSDLFVGRTAGKPLVSVYVPLVREGKVSAVLGMGTFAESVAKLLEQFDMPQEHFGIIVDNAGTVVAQSRDNASAVGMPAGRWLVDAARQAPRGVTEGIARDGVKLRAAFARTPVSQWTVAIGAPAGDWPRTGPVLGFVLTGIVLFLGLVYYAGRQARALAESVARAATAAALAPVRSAAPPPATARDVFYRYGIALAAAILGLLVRWALDPVLGDAVPFITLLPAVMLAVWFGGFGPGVACTLLGYGAVNFFLMEPRFAFGFPKQNDLVAFVLYLSVSLLIVWMGARMRSAEMSEAQRAKEAEAGNILLRTLLDNVPLGIVICGGAPDFRVLASSRQAKDLHVGPSQDGPTPHILPTPDSRGEPTPLLRAAQFGTVTAERETTVVRTDGTAAKLMVSAVPVRNSSNVVIGAIECFYDVSELKAIEARLREVDSRKDAFMATLAHELRNPLASLRNALEIQHTAGNVGDVAQRAGEVVKRQVDQITRLVDDLLDISRINHGKIDVSLAPMNLSQVLADAVASSERDFAEAGLSINVTSAPAEAWVNADRARMLQVLSNLLVNALKFTPRGGHVEVEQRAHADEVTIAIRDNGIGLDADFLPRVFLPFEQAAGPGERQRGLGIGLALVQQLMDLQSGYVRVSSAGIGKGSEFVVGLPRIPAPTTTLPQPVAPVADRDRCAVRNVIVADDNVDAAETTAALIRMAGHSVRVATSGLQALAEARDHRPDVMIVDLGMPGMSGFEVARQVRAEPELAKVVLIALTGWGQDTHRKETAASGFDHHLVKPADPQQILDLLVPAMPGLPSRH